MVNPQLMDNLANIIAIYVKIIDFQSSNGVYLLKEVGMNVFSIHAI